MNLITDVDHNIGDTALANDVNYIVKILRILISNIGNYIQWPKWRQYNKEKISHCTKICVQLPAYKYILKVNNTKARRKWEICSKLTIKTPERLHWSRPGAFNVNSEHISHLFLVLLVLTYNI